MISGRLSIRSYISQSRQHKHDYHQIVLPLQGVIEMQVGEFDGKVSVGDAIVIHAGLNHSFSADEAARFLVVDLSQLPPNLCHAETKKFLLSPATLAYVQFAGLQLMSKTNAHLENAMCGMLLQLLEQQGQQLRIDPRIASVISEIQQDISQNWSVERLAKLSFLSPTQFKTVFKSNLGQTSQQFVLQLRMEKAKALLTHTDLPVQLIGEKVGFSNPSAFTRRFSQFFGLSPKSYR